MDERLCLEVRIDNYASVVIEWLDIDARMHNIPRAQIIQKFVDALWVNEQIKSQED